MDEQHVSSNAAAVDDDQPAPRPIPGWLQECSANPRRILEFCERHDLSCSLEDAIKLVRAHFNPAKLDVETDGDTWHSDPQRIPEDNLRDNDLETGGWKLLRFNTLQLNEQMGDYCLPTIAKNIKKMGGLSDSRLIPRDIQTDPNAPSQMSLFDDQHDVAGGG